MASLQGIVDFIETTETSLSKDLKVSLDKDKLEQQLLDHRKLESDIRLERGREEVEREGRMSNVI